MKKKKDREHGHMECREINVILRIPETAASVSINAVILDEDDKPVKVGRRLTSEDIRKARQDFLENVEDGDEYDARYVLTEKGKAWLEKLKGGGSDE